MSIITEMTPEEVILVKIYEQIRILEDRITEVDIEKTIGMIEVGVGLEKDNIKVILEGMIEVAVVHLDWIQEQILIEVE